MRQGASLSEQAQLILAKGTLIQLSHVASQTSRRKSRLLLISRQVPNTQQFWELIRTL